MTEFEYIKQMNLQEMGYFIMDIALDKGYLTDALYGKEKTDIKALTEFLNSEHKEQKLF